MSRLAGPLRDAWQKQVRELRREKARTAGWVPPTAPSAHPSAKRRQMALLWYMNRYLPDGLIIGAKGFPPLTSDMRALLTKKYLLLGREGSGFITFRNRLKLTDAGSAVLAQARLSFDDKRYFLLAFNTGSLR